MFFPFASRKSRLTVFFTVLFVLALTGGGVKSYALEPQEIELTEIDENFIEQAVISLCSQKLYNSRDVYDTGHFLMLPMKYAFEHDNENMIQAFSDMFSNFVSDEGEIKEEFNNTSGLNRNHYLYLMSEYLRLCADFNKKADQIILDTVVNYMVSYNETYTRNWATDKDYKSFQELMAGLLHGEGYGRDDSLNNVITDNDTFPLAIMCNCLYTIKNTSLTSEHEDLLQWAAETAEDMMKICCVDNGNDAWIFQPGAWRDYRDYWYAGYSKKADVDPDVPKKVNGIGPDSSHFTRFASFINTYARVAKDTAYFDKLKAGCANLFMNTILKAKENDGEYYVLINFTDGTNGVFRYNYHDDKGSGYDPYQMSTTFLNGWWSLLDDERITAVYKDTYDKLKFESSLPDEYIDPVTVRARNPFYTSINNYKMLTYIASSTLEDENENKNENNSEEEQKADNTDTDTALISSSGSGCNIKILPAFTALIFIVNLPFKKKS